VADLDDALKKLPPETQRLLGSIWETLAPSERNTLTSLIAAFPSQNTLVKLLIKLSTAQFKQTFGEKHAVAIVGPANVGKSTLYNQFVQSNQDRAEVSPVPGTTRVNQQADAGVFSVVDTPGADAVGEVGERERDEALSAARDADFLVILFDAIQGVKQTELQLFQELTALGKPFIVALNKIDLVKKDKNRVIEQAARNLNLTTEQLIPLSAKSGDNLSQVLMAIAMTEPRIVNALGRALPQYRWQLAWRSIISAASISAAIALSPLPVIDFAPLIVTQAVMVLGIARIYDYKINLERAQELVATFGLAMLGRTLFQQLSKFGGLPGWVLSAAIASSTTVVMGYASVIWFEKGEKLSRRTITALTKGVTQYLLGALKGMGKRKPGKKSLQEAVEQALENSPMAEAPTILEEMDQQIPQGSAVEDQTEDTSDLDEMEQRPPDNAAGYDQNSGEWTI